MERLNNNDLTVYLPNPFGSIKIEILSESYSCRSEINFFIKPNFKIPNSCHLPPLRAIFPLFIPSTSLYSITKKNHPKTITPTTTK